MIVEKNKKALVAALAFIMLVSGLGVVYVMLPTDAGEYDDVGGSAESPAGNKAGMLLEYLLADAVITTTTTLAEEEIFEIDDIELPVEYGGDDSVAFEDASTAHKTTTTTVLGIECDTLEEDERMTCNAIRLRDIRYCPMREYTNFDIWLSKNDSCERSVFEAGFGVDECKLLSSDPVWGLYCCRYIAIHAGDPGLCAKCHDEQRLINLCHQAFEQHQRELLESDMNVCKAHLSYSDDCIRKNAERLLDFSLCELYIQESKRITCFYDTCRKSMSENPQRECCPQIPYAGGAGSWHRNECYIQRAVVDMDVKWCGYIVSETPRAGLYDRCYFEVAKSKDDVGECAVVEVTNTRENCILELAKTKSDCEGISDSARLKSCLRKTQ
jgi:hypothetical protein